MGEIFKKALGVFVDFKDEEQPETAEATEAASPAAPAAVTLEPGPELAQDPDVTRARQAIAMLADLPLAEIPVEKARKLIAGALRLGGLDAGDLAGSFQRATELYKAAMAAEEQAIAARQQLNAQRLQLLEKALAEEKEQCTAEVSERGRRIEQSRTELGQIEQAMAFFVEEDR